MKVNGQNKPCVRNSAYTFILILLKLFRCLDHDLKIYMWIGYNPQINFGTFSQFELSRFSCILITKVNGQWIPCVRNYSYNLIPILLKLYRCLEHTLKISMWFEYNPHFFFSF